MDDYSADKPFTAGPLRGTSVTVTTGENPVVDIRFSNATQREMFLTEPKNKTDLRAFLVSRLEAHTPFALEFSSGNSDAPLPPSAFGPESLDDLCRREPIIKTLLDLFEGRVLDGTL